MGSGLEHSFAVVWSLYGSRPAEQQVKFHPDRDWPFDFAWIDRLLALEIQGGGFVRGAHSRPVGQRRDCEKNNAAIMLGWRVMTATTDMLRDDPIGLCDQINYLLQHPALTPNAEESMWLARVRTLTRDGMACNANGITVTRLKLRQYSIQTGSGVYPLKAQPSEVPNFILGKQNMTGKMVAFHD